MIPAAPYFVLEPLGPVLSTTEVAAALETTVQSAIRVLRRLEREGLVSRVVRGRWTIGTKPLDPFLLAPELTRPHPAYVSFNTALNFHGLINQLPKAIDVASLARARDVTTSLARYEIHHLPGELFGGWKETPRGNIATPEKALFDLCYVVAAHRGRSRKIPELDIPPEFDRATIDQWVLRIEAKRLRTITKQAVSDSLRRVQR
jgi:predicted transcriptional regulator of viral defense system